jgi:3-methyladenine DNA glycosylase AlkD
MPTTAPTVDDVVRRLRVLARPGGREGMARFGINAEHALGVRVADLREVAKELGRDHRLAGALWATGIHEARILASMVEEPARVTEAQMERWVRAFDSWDLCDQVCANLFDRTPYAVRKAREWSGREEEFVMRAAFALMASLAVHRRDLDDSVFVDFLRVIEREAGDDRNYVKKAVSWALRQIGKRSVRLHRAAIHAAERIARQRSRAPTWIASDALRELRSEAVVRRLRDR